jgi:Secretion system C-terminal sorting domain
LKQTDFDGNTNFGNILQVNQCEMAGAENSALYPNPSANGKFELSYSGDKSQVISIEIFNALGEKIYGSPGFKPDFDLSSKAAGVYFVQVQTHSKPINLKLVVKE